MIISNNKGLYEISSAAVSISAANMMHTAEVAGSRIDRTHALSKRIARVPEPNYILKSDVGRRPSTSWDLVKTGRSAGPTALTNAPASSTKSLSSSVFFEGFREDNLAGVINYKTSVFSLEAVVVQLARLREGWAGPETVAPSEAILQDILVVSPYLPPNVPAPVVEVDPDDGCVTLVWKSDNTEQCFATVFSGSGAIMGVAPNQANYKPWRLSVSDELGVASKLEDDAALGQFSY